MGRAEPAAGGICVPEAQSQLGRRWREKGGQVGEGLCLESGGVCRPPQEPGGSGRGLGGILPGHWHGHPQLCRRVKDRSLHPVLLPVYEHVNDDFGAKNHVNAAAKLYVLFYDTDIDLLAFVGGSRTARYGVDFAKNLLTNLEIHGEWAYVTNFNTRLINAQGQLFSRTSDVMSYLLGLRYLTPQDTTFILEYYYNGTGFTPTDVRDFVTFVDDSDATFQRTGNASGLQRAQTLAEGAYGRPNFMRHYLYVRASQKEPFDILYFTPALTSIVNVSDGSFNVIPELVYSPVTNLELRFRAVGLFGTQGTEYGEKQNDYRLELRIRYFWGW
jgi:hypothetical protein